MEQLGMFGTRPVNAKKTGDELRDEGIAKAMKNADEKWKQAARDAVLVVVRSLKSGDTFTTDAVHQVLDWSEAETHDTRALGGILRSLSNEGVIQATGQYQKTMRPIAHSRPLMVWKVL